MLELMNICKRYKPSKSSFYLHDISFSVKKGSAFALFGHNGSGKSTIIKIAAALMYPDKGSVSYNGRSVFESGNSFKRIAALVLGSKTSLQWDYEFGDSLRILSAIYKMQKSQADRSFNQLDEYFSVKEFLKTRIRDLSLGQRMRCELCAGFFHSPELIFLDEPTIGLDEDSCKALHNFILATKAKHTLVIASHVLNDIYAMCDEVCILAEGKIASHCSISEFEASKKCISSDSYD